MTKKLETATFAAGCFWGVEDAFSKLGGVEETIVGYTGGHTENPTYEQVCTDTTGHAEAVEVRYNPEKITYKELLEKFWSIHNPTTVNRQGPDIGSQYRSVVFTHGEGQAEEAKEIMHKLEEEKKFNKPIVTEIIPASEFYVAEDYHQKYFQKTGKSACHI